ncbi:glycosyltransferase family 2 protein [Nocardia arthritidis]|uniref:Glycosyltransferase n=1 Tax=Nocardia arthritidis TaxID=228602 RepID=A0A6G9YN67_9NOCA|nr:glycosyltransferase [Nocardia arthritidis]QIS14654.1 glycosyltransferase [Nocardia arthritidis]
MVARSVSIVIPVFISDAEGLGFLDVQLGAIAEQDYVGPLEVVVADNGSPTFVRRHILEHPLREKLDLKWVDASAHKGAAFARNIGADHAEGEILLFCDHDDKAYPNWARRLVEFLEEGYDLVCSAVEGKSLNADNPRGVADVPAPDKFQPAGVFAPIIIAGSTACRAEVYRKLGGMDVTYPANEDVEFGWRVHNAGYRTGFLPEALLAYRYRPGFKPGYRQGRSRGIGLARLNAEYPGNGMPEIRLPELLVRICGLAVARGLVSEERGLLLGIAVGQLRGGARYHTLRWL